MLFFIGLSCYNDMNAVSSILVKGEEKGCMPWFYA